MSLTAFLNQGHRYLGSPALSEAKQPDPTLGNNIRQFKTAATSHKNKTTTLLQVAQWSSFPDCPEKHEDKHHCQSWLKKCKRPFLCMADVFSEVGVTLSQILRQWQPGCSFPCVENSTVLVMSWKAEQEFLGWPHQAVFKRQWGMVERIGEEIEKRIYERRKKPQKINNKKENIRKASSQL